jgi:8-oxo-dGTP pyrophosphatase MutT (NUDIX family)
MSNIGISNIGMGYKYSGNTKKIFNNKFYNSIKKNESSFNNKHNFIKNFGKINMVSSNIIHNSNSNSSNSSNSSVVGNGNQLVKFYSYSDAVNVNNIDPAFTNIINPNTNFYNVANTNTNENANTHSLFCANCGNVGHIFKNCQEPVISYGLICFYKKKTFINTTNLNNQSGNQFNDYYNKKTRKNEDINNNGNNGNNGNNKFIKKYNNIPKIKILKKNETLTHTLKNMLGITGINNKNEYDDYNDYNDYNADLESVVDVEEIIDMDNEYDTTSNSITSANNIKEITTGKIILVQRRHTIGFIEFIRGKYDISNHEYIIKLFNMMTFDEKRLIREYDNFDVIRTIIGLKREHNYKLEYDEAKKKFNDLRNHTDSNMIFKLLDKSYTRWTTPEWGIPKGRRNHKEYDIECAVREFVEETGIKYKHINVYRNVKPLEEIYKGINGVVYKHIYYLASIKENDDARMNIEIIEKGGQINYEVCNVKLFNLRECHKIIRPYYISKLNVIKKGFQLINSMDYYFE